MKKRLIDIFLDISIILTILIIIYCLIEILLVETLPTETNFLKILVLVAIIEFVCMFAIRMYNKRKRKDVYKLNKLIEYDKKRKEIEEEISYLTKELTKSDVADYIDVNRLVFMGQNEVMNNRAINYASFLNQFGIQKELIKIKEGSALFLTPFTYEGNLLFKTCQEVLSGIDIFLQRTDNRVDKDDILMNIVSLILQSEIIIVNINGRNPNVYYELGIAHAIGKPTILLSHSDFSYDDIGFDIRQKRIIMYKDEKDLEKKLLYQITRMRNNQSQGKIDANSLFLFDKYDI